MKMANLNQKYFIYSYNFILIFIQGMAFVEFEDPEDALKFIKSFSLKENYSKFNQNKTPIIEFSIEDIRKTKKIEKILASRKTEKKKPEKDAKKLEEINKTTHSYKLLIEDLINKKNPDDLDMIKTYLKNIKSRGIKQRLHKRMVACFGLEKPEAPQKKKIETKKNQKGILKTNANKKNSTSTTTENIQKKQKEPNEIKNTQEIKKIIKTRKEKSKLKRKAIENDEFDVNIKNELF